VDECKPLGVGPVVFLRRTTLPLVKQFFAEVDLSTCPYYQAGAHTRPLFSST